MKNLWSKLPKPFVALAPMYDVTDEPFRQMFAKYGKPDVFFTEFVSADGLVSEMGRPKVSRELYFQPNEHPIVAQVFGANPDKFYEAAKIIATLGFDGLDINMGCPDKTILKQGAGGALIKTPALAKEIILAAKEGAGDMPVSVKTRLGYSQTTEYKKWLENLITCHPSLITVHFRTVKEMSKVSAHWELAGEVASLIHSGGVLVAGNGDVSSLEEAQAKAKEFNLDGVMIGRGAFGNPWFFAGKENPPVKEKLKALLEHCALFERLYGQTESNQELFDGHTKNFAVMKKHFKAYVNGFSGSSALRAKLMETTNCPQVHAIISKFLSS